MSAWLGWVGARGRQSWAARERSRPAWVVATQGREEAWRGVGLGPWAVGKGEMGRLGQKGEEGVSEVCFFFKCFSNSFESF